MSTPIYQTYRTLIKNRPIMLIKRKRRNNMLIWNDGSDAFVLVSEIAFCRLGVKPDKFGKNYHVRVYSKTPHICMKATYPTGYIPVTEPVLILGVSQDKEETLRLLKQIAKQIEGLSD